MSLACRRAAERRTRSPVEARARPARGHSRERRRPHQRSSSERAAECAAALLLTSACGTVGHRWPLHGGWRLGCQDELHVHDLHIQIVGQRPGVVWGTCWC